MLQPTKLPNVRLVMMRMMIQPSAPEKGTLPPLKYVHVENGRKPKRSKVPDRKSHWSGMAAGSKGRAKTDMESYSIGNKGTMDGTSRN